MSNSVTFYVNERPIDPLIITVTDRTLAGLDIALVGEIPGDPTVTIYDSDAGQVAVEFHSHFTVAGSFQGQVELLTGSGETDLTEPFLVKVLDPEDSTNTLVARADVEQTTGASVSNTDIFKAQGLISLVVGRDLLDTVWLQTLSVRDTYWLKMAVIYQAADMSEKEASKFQMPYVPNATQITNGDISVTLNNSPNDATASVAPLARTALLRLTWMNTQRSVQAKPYIGTERLQPDPWRRLYKMGRV